MATTPGRIRPWRYLTAFVGIVAALYALVFFTGDRSVTPKLGIDLQGGTRVTLEARTESGAEAPREQLLQAQSIIQERVDGLGVGGAEVVLDGSNLTITVPGQEGEQARSLGQTAQLRFREVVGGPVAATPPAPAPGATDPAAPPAGTDPAAPSGQAPVPPVEPSVAPPAPAEQPPAGQPQGAGDPAAPVVESPVAPISYSTPLAGGDPAGQPTPEPTPPAPTPTPGAGTPPAAGTPAGPADPELAAAISAARESRQSLDPAVQAQALAQLDCQAQDPLRGYDDPQRPLVACNQDGTEKYVLGPVFLEGTQIDTAQAQQNMQGVGWVISLTFKSEGAAIWGEYTTQNVGKSAAFVLDGEVVSAPRINGPIFGTTEISGQFNQESAQQLAGVLRYGSLPLSFSSSEAQTVSATLGLASLEAGLIAGGIGLLLVFVYCLIYYRVLGVLTILSLVLSGLVVYAVLVLLGRWIGFTLDLAGVAGFIVAIGITADSFVIFFERLKDEVRDGRTFRSAVPRGWVRARRTILSADAVSFLASAVLYLLAVGQVKGFAFTLGLSTVLDLLVVFLVTHPLVALASNSRVFGSPVMSGLGSMARIGAERKRAAATAGASKGA
ncbi:protein translocase subunit SecD [Pseudonocardia humida]|uniref:Protein translocase subunit SecD n=1 Tax=Pseudonocardia humida TaxID=2800819 RepID=A0ABT0ZRU6_9PSEU|nr:protein translocase subunit SecD [Pseudonocardia humida]MCO1653439.1 protein translocase subunit SecD [Pseudonocardia humida]